MSIAIVHSPDPITLVGGGQATAKDLAEALTIAPRCVAVDGGLALVARAGVTPDAVIGDMDSVPPETLAAVPAERQHRLSEQQTTDFDKALRHIDAPLAIGVGFTGGRMDHQLAAFHTLLVHSHRPCVLLGAQEIVVHAPPRITLDLPEGAIVSLYPMQKVAGHSTGLVWPIEGLAFDPARFIGTSNRATGPVEITMEAPGMLLILGRGHLRQVAACLRQSDARWPARAG